MGFLESLTLFWAILDPCREGQAIGFVIATTAAGALNEREAEGDRKPHVVVTDHQV